MSVEAVAVGDVVQLKSGGPLMTISWVENGSAYCEWFDDKKNTGASFPITSLTKKNT